MGTDGSKLPKVHTYTLCFIGPGETEPNATYWSTSPFQDFHVGDAIAPHSYGSTVDKRAKGENNIQHQVGEVRREVSYDRDDDEILDTTWIYLVAYKPKTNRDESSSANTVPVYMVCKGETKLLRVSRVPLVDEIVYTTDQKNPTKGTRWRVVSVQHLPHAEKRSGMFEHVAELYAVAVGTFDAWNGQFPND